MLRRKQWVLAMLAMIVFCAPAFSNTVISGGDVAGVWRAVDSPFNIQNDIRVAAGTTLSIEAGTEIHFEAAVGLVVNGTLLAEGTEAAPILFTAVNESAGWTGIRFVGASDDSRITYGIIEKGYAYGGITDRRGGGIYIENSSPTISHSIIRNNRARYAGGGIYLENSGAMLRDNHILDNRAGTTGTSAQGGGIRIFDASPTLINNTISGNRVYVAGSYTTPTARGSGLDVSRSEVVLIGNLIGGNTIDAHNNSNSYGVGIAADGSTLDLINNTVVDNVFTNPATGFYTMKRGGGLYFADSDVVLLNSIVSSNSHEQVTVSSYNFQSTLTVAHSNVNGGANSVQGLPNLTVQWLDGNIDRDAGFVDPANGDYTLQSNSPAVDAGTAAFSSGGQTFLDLGDSDYIGAAPDMGAFEFGGERAGGDGDSGGSDSPAPDDEEPASQPSQIHVQDQQLVRTLSFWRYVRVADLVSIIDETNNLVADATVTVRYTGFADGEITATTGSNGVARLETPMLRNRGGGSLCFEVTQVSKDGFEYVASANTVTTVCE